MSKHTVLAIALALSATLAVADSKNQPTEAQIDAAFEKLDRDKSGTLSWAEAKRLGFTQAAFEEANPDKDGTLDKKEFAAALDIQFKRANPDGDGTLDMAEARKAGITDEATFKSANPDKDGTLDRAEYLAALLAQMK